MIQDPKAQAEFVLRDQNGTVQVASTGPITFYGPDYVPGCRINWLFRVERAVKAEGKALARIRRLLPKLQPDSDDPTAIRPKASDVLKALEAGTDAASIFLKLSELDRDDLLRQAVRANVWGEDDHGLGSMLEQVVFDHLQASNLDLDDADEDVADDDA